MTRPLELQDLDFSVLQQCIHCGMCLPTCPTYDATKLERNSPRGRIALMRSVAEEKLEVTKAFGEEMYFCLGCLACETACPAGVDYALMFEKARADIEDSGVLETPGRSRWRALVLRGLFTRPRLLRGFGRLLYLYQNSGLQTLVRGVGLPRLLPRKLRELEPLTPTIEPRFSDVRIAAIETPPEAKYRVALLTGCVQDLTHASVNRDTADALLANGCAVVTPRRQSCCGSLHAHNGDLETARMLARRQLDAFDLESLDAIISNAGGCGSHLRHYGELLRHDPRYFDRAALWDRKMRDIHEWLVEIDFRPPTAALDPVVVTYHDSCHLCHGQKIVRQPRALLRAIPGVELRELPEASWCCGSAGIYNITQPVMSRRLLERKINHIESMRPDILATANPGCLIQIEAGLRERKATFRICHPITLLAEAYRREIP